MRLSWSDARVEGFGLISGLALLLLLTGCATQPRSLGERPWSLRHSAATKLRASDTPQGKRELPSTTDRQITRGGDDGPPLESRRIVAAAQGQPFIDIRDTVSLEEEPTKAPRYIENAIKGVTSVGWGPFQLITDVSTEMPDGSIYLERSAIYFDGDPLSDSHVEIRVVFRSPELAEAMIFLGENGFLIGREAFKTEAELVKTILHELHRLTTSVVRSEGATMTTVHTETQAAKAFADRAFKAALEQGRQ